MNSEKQQQDKSLTLWISCPLTVVLPSLSFSVLFIHICCLFWTNKRIHCKATINQHACLCDYGRQGTDCGVVRCYSLALRVVASAHHCTPCGRASIGAVIRGWWRHAETASWTMTSQLPAVSDAETTRSPVSTSGRSDASNGSCCDITAVHCQPRIVQRNTPIHSVM